MDREESRILEALDLAVRSEAIRRKIEAIAARVAQKLRERPDEVLAWEPIPLDFYTTAPRWAHDQADNPNSREPGSQHSRRPPRP